MNSPLMVVMDNALALILHREHEVHEWRLLTFNVCQHDMLSMKVMPRMGSVYSSTKDAITTSIVQLIIADARQVQLRRH